jgi:hypothetical protein
MIEAGGSLFPPRESSRALFAAASIPFALRDFVVWRAERS